MPSGRHQGSDRNHYETFEDGLDSEDIAILDEGINSIPPPLSSPSSYPGLTKPIAIPQIAISSMIKPPSPFTRAYAPVLSYYGLSKRDFLKMVDTINICLAASPPFQVMQIASTGIGFIPHHWATAASAGLGVLAGAGTAATTYVRTKRFFDKINKEVWEPRGLKMAMIKDPELLTLLEISEQAAWSRTSSPEARGANQLPESMPKRRLHGLGPHVAELDFDVPPPENPGNILDKLSAKQQAFQASKREKKMLKKVRKREQKRSKVEAKYGIQLDELPPNEFNYDSSSSSDTHASSVASLERQLTKAERQIEKLNRKYDGKLVGASPKKAAEIEKERLKKIREVEKEAGKTERELSKKKEKRLGKRLERNAKKEEKASKKIGKLQWIVIKNLDA